MAGRAARLPGRHRTLRVPDRWWGTYGPQRYRVVLPAQIDHLGDTSSVAELTTVRVIPYRIETRGDIVVSMKEFRARTDEIYADPRGWSRAHVHFKRVRQRWRVLAGAEPGLVRPEILRRSVTATGAVGSVAT